MNSDPPVSSQLIKFFGSERIPGQGNAAAGLVGNPKDP